MECKFIYKNKNIVDYNTPKYGIVVENIRVRCNWQLLL